MQPGKLLGLIVLLVVSSIFSCHCNKNEDNINPDDPYNLKVEVLFINHETGFVQIQATSENTVKYQLYIEPSEVPEEENPNGYFEYTFEKQGTHEFSVRAYGASGRYLKTSKKVTIAYEPETVPLNRGYFSPSEYEGYNLVWQDEFNGTTLTSTEWSYEIGDGCPGNCGWGNNELEYYRTENVWVADSVLTIEAREESFGNKNYTSARIKTQGKKSFTYGRIDARALLPEGKGLWPAIWTLGESISSSGWPSCGEIDIMEMIGGNAGESTVYGTVHWEHNGEHAQAGGSKTLSNSPYNFSESYHVFSVVWDENYIKWFVDNVQYYEINITGADMSEFHEPHFIIMNVAVGGNWPGSPDNNTLFPQQMKVDYIRVFQQR